MSKSKRILLAALSLGLILGGCKEDNEEVKPAAQITAKAGADQNAKVGSVVTLDGTGSTDSESTPFEFSWAFSKKPAGSTVNLTGPATGKPTFKPDLPGEYEVELTVKNQNGESKDKVVVTATVVEPIVLETAIKTKTVLENRIDDPAFPDYIVNANVVVTSELELKPGVVIAFARDTRLEVNDGGGVLIAKGDSLKPIRLVGKETTKGFWAGVIVRSGSSANAFEYLEVKHAGSKALISTTKAGMAVLGNSKAQVSIKNCLFEQNAGFGLFIDHYAIIGGFSRNNFKDNGEAGILLDAENVKALDVNSTFTNGNGRNVVEVLASSLSKNGGQEVVWSGFKDKTPYRILESLTSDANWKLLPGVTLQMSRNARLSIDDGYLNAKGTATSKIVITGDESAAGYWRGLICFSTSNMNVLEYAEISGGGSTALVSGKKANIAVYGGQSRMQIRNSKIASSAGYGIFVNYQGSVNEDIETINTFADNVQGKLLKE